MKDAAAMSPNALAEACAAAMWASDTAVQTLGVKILEIGPGFAQLSMPVAPHMLNGHGLAHGGYIFTLADSAFAYACNTYDERAVAAQCSITFLRPGAGGRLLIATARELSRIGRSGIYDVSVADGATIIAEFRGHSRTIGGTLLAHETDAAAT